MDFNPIDFIVLLFLIFLLYLLYKWIKEDKVEKNNQEELILLDADDAKFIKWLNQTCPQGNIIEIRKQYEKYLTDNNN